MAAGLVIEAVSHSESLNTLTKSKLLDVRKTDKENKNHNNHNHNDNGNDSILRSDDSMEELPLSDSVVSNNPSSSSNSNLTIPIANKAEMKSNSESSTESASMDIGEEHQQQQQQAADINSSHTPNQAQSVGLANDEAIIDDVIDEQIIDEIIDDANNLAHTSSSPTQHLQSRDEDRSPSELHNAYRELLMTESHKLRAENKRLAEKLERLRETRSSYQNLFAQLRSNDERFDAEHDTNRESKINDDDDNKNDDNQDDDGDVKLQENEEEEGLEIPHENDVERVLSRASSTPLQRMRRKEEKKRLRQERLLKFTKTRLEQQPQTTSVRDAHDALSHLTPFIPRICSTPGCNHPVRHGRTICCRGCPKKMHTKSCHQRALELIQPSQSQQSQQHHHASRRHNHNHNPSDEQKEEERRTPRSLWHELSAINPQIALCNDYVRMHHTRDVDVRLPPVPDAEDEKTAAHTPSSDFFSRSAVRSAEQRHSRQSRAHSNNGDRPRHRRTPAISGRDWSDIMPYIESDHDDDDDEEQQLQLQLEVDVEEQKSAQPLVPPPPPPPSSSQQERRHNRSLIKEQLQSLRRRMKRSSRTATSLFAAASSATSDRSRNLLHRTASNGNPFVSASSASSSSRHQRAPRSPRQPAHAHVHSSSIAAEGMPRLLRADERARLYTASLTEQQRARRSSVATAATSSYPRTRSRSHLRPRRASTSSASTFGTYRFRRPQSASIAHHAAYATHNHHRHNNHAQLQSAATTATAMRASSSTSSSLNGNPFVAPPLALRANSVHEDNRNGTWPSRLLPPPFVPRMRSATTMDSASNNNNSNGRNDRNEESLLRLRLSGLVSDSHRRHRDHDNDNDNDNGNDSDQANQGSDWSHHSASPTSTPSSSFPTNANANPNPSTAGDEEIARLLQARSVFLQQYANWSRRHSAHSRHSHGHRSRGSAFDVYELRQRLNSSQRARHRHSHSQSHTSMTSLVRHLPVRQITALDLHKGNEAVQACSICQERFVVGDKVKTLPCFHFFHVDEIDRWLTNSKMCPVCRHSIDEINFK